uniref:STAS domain-containing protein n=1 Tax=Strongyloides stercoralis TaxID=6248 RepID=A0A0K0ECY7_STRER
MSLEGDNNECSNKSVIYSVTRNALTQKEFDETFKYSKKNNKSFKKKSKKFFLKILKKNSFSKECFMNWIPIIRWIKDYNIKWLTNDIFAGITVAIMNVPQSMAYAQLAKLPPVIGLYTSFLPTLIYAIFGTSKHISLGMFAVVALMVGTAQQNYYVNNNLSSENISNIATNQLDPKTLNLLTPIEITVTITFFCGLSMLVMSIFQLHILTTFLSDELVGGFTTGAACHVFSSQFPKLLDIHVKSHNGLLKLFKIAIDFFSNIGKTNFASLITSIVCLIVLYVGKEYINPIVRKKVPFPIPFELFVVIATTLLSYFVGFHKKYNVNIVSKIPTGFPSPTSPSFWAFSSLIVDAITISIVIYAISFSCGKIFAKKHKYRICPKQELRALALVEIIASFFSCHPASGSLSRSTVNSQMGCHSQAGSIISALAILLVILWVGPLLEPLPLCVLSCIIIIALQTMFKQFLEVPNLFKKSVVDFSIWVVTFLSVFLWDVSEGLLIGIGFALLTVIFRIQWPKTAVVAKIGDTDIYKDVSRYKSNNEIPHILIYRFDAPLIFLNCENFKKTITNLLNHIHIENEDINDIENNNQINLKNTKYLIVDCTGITSIDYMGVKYLEELYLELKQLDRKLLLAGCKFPLRKMFEICGTYSIISKDYFFPSIHDAVLKVIYKNVQYVPRGQVQYRTINCNRNCNNNNIQNKFKVIQKPIKNIKIVPNNIKIPSNVKIITKPPNIELVTPISTINPHNNLTTRITAATQPPYTPSTIQQLIISTTSSILPNRIISNITTNSTPTDSPTSIFTTISSTKIVPTTIPTVLPTTTTTSSTTTSSTTTSSTTTSTTTTSSTTTSTSIISTTVTENDISTTLQTTSPINFVTPVTITSLNITTINEKNNIYETTEKSFTLTEEDLKATTTYFRRPNRKSTTNKIIPLTEEVSETILPIDEITTESITQSPTTIQLSSETSINVIENKTLPTEESTIESTTSYISSKINPCPNGEPNGWSENSTFSTCSYLLPENGGCPENYYCHTGATFSTTTCCPLLEEEGNICDLPRTSGEGENFLPRWYHDKLSNSCKRFVFKGLRGNGNNFMSQYDCEVACVIPNTPKPFDIINPCSYGEPAVLNNDTLSRIQCTGPNDLNCPVDYYCHLGIFPSESACCPKLGEEKCDQPLLVGEGNGILERFYYNKEKEECEKFIFSGLKSNENNFLSKSECERICKAWISPCPDSSNTKPPRKNCNSCTDDEWCHIGDTPSNTVCCPNPSKDICSEPMKIGNGNGNVTRWYAYEDDGSCERKCKSFNYSGSGGTQNNFLTKEECESLCRKDCPNPCSSGELLLNSNGNPRQCNPSSPCPSGYWCHVGETQQSTVCCSSVPNVCELPLNMGVGESKLQRYYYDSLLKSCLPFNYKGMLGNQNMFLTEDDCKIICPVYENPCAIDSPLLTSSKRPKICSPSSRCPSTHFCHIGPSNTDNYCCRKNGNPCEQELQEGLGNHSLSRFYYDLLTRTCKPFIYLGEKGNANNFLTKSDCEIVCPVIINPCSIGNPLTDPNGDSVVCGGHDTCPSDYYCHIGSAPDTTNCCPIIEGNICKMILQKGEGNEKLERWYYNSTSQKCLKFIYNGLKGNPNNFLTLNECTKTCQDSNPCLNGEPLTSLTNQRIQCSSYNGIDTCPSSHFCHLGGSSSDTVCCPRMTQDPCEQPLNEGEGNRMINRWYFDTGLNKCLPFIYAGFKGNENNFPSKNQCNSACPEYKYYCPHGLPILSSDNENLPLTCSIDKACPDGSICHMNIEFNIAICCEDPSYFCNEKRDHGPCDGNEIRYGYDSETDTCIEYEFGGCGGTLNNFLSLKRCTEVCCKNTK